MEVTFEPSQGEPSTQYSAANLCDRGLLDELKGIPDQLAFKIGDVAEYLGVKQYVLRYWESEFDVLRPRKSKNNQRVYTKRDVETAFLIRKLLHRDRFSIEGARAVLKDLRNQVKEERSWDEANSQLRDIQNRLDFLIRDIRQAQELF